MARKPQTLPLKPGIRRISHIAGMDKASDPNEMSVRGIPSDSFENQGIHTNRCWKNG